mmetsp:Transcript_5560/g.34445  ORF Transcript_5560/g.34445 Transcript_5560/m.34445 type:complete len:206 (-) Transcript_5560:582-1199(-)
MSEHQHAQSRLGAQGKRQVWLFWGRFSSVLQLRQHLAQVQGRAREEESITEHRLLGILDCVTVGFPCSVGSYFFYRCIGSTGSCPWGVNQLGRLSLQPRLRPRRTLVVPCVSLDTAAMVGVFVVFTAFHRPVGFVLLQAFSLLLPFGLGAFQSRADPSFKGQSNAFTTRACCDATLSTLFYFCGRTCRVSCDHWLGHQHVLVTLS